ncbi:hypothetical protein BH24ACT1_BH24ACT1_12480 [soil metagenome]
MTHYDQPPPDRIEDLDALAGGDRFRFANELRAWVEVADGRIVAHGQSGTGWIGLTTLGRGRASLTFPAVALPDLRSTPQVNSSSIRFVQTAGGRTALPAPRRVNHPPFVQVEAPLAWTTLALTLHADGSSSGEMVGASPFPRHWLYDDKGRLVAKSGLIDFTTWYRDAFGRRTPWGDADSPALVTEVETALERSLATTIMRRDAKPSIRKVRIGTALVEQGQPGTELYLLLDGVLRVEIDGSALADLGPGSLVGERALLEGGRRTSTLRAVTACKVAVASATDIDPEALAELSLVHRREDG